MSITAIRMTMEKIIDKPVTFLLLTIGIYLIVLALIAVVGYVIACTRNAKTEMTGVMRVSITLNTWFESGLLQDAVEMDYGSIWIPMKQPAGADGQVLTELNWKEKAICRRYKVSTMLRRYLTAFKAAGLGEDPSARLLEELLGKETFCDALGDFCYRSSKRGLIVTGTPDAKRAATRKRRACTANWTAVPLTWRRMPTRMRQIAMSRPFASRWNIKCNWGKNNVEYYSGNTAVSSTLHGMWRKNR